MYLVVVKIPDVAIENCLARVVSFNNVTDVKIGTVWMRLTAVKVEISCLVCYENQFVPNARNSSKLEEQ